ncbi:aldo keto reductase family protein [Stylonychia lemnae]|uniref:Aldo keto reductase family protein n=1 Tax=Stylonychia lemnae TaxID=5949 RepID=A0A078AWC0_STYLE|nr:aldo keto reductase family protein [Stylonychia lemnae]|eukprot:CDW85098.1 aldo keto reductase family protein [Stylonychia lemnae]
MQEDLTNNSTENSPIYNQSVLLLDGRSIPQIGMGTWKIPDQESMDKAIDAALEVGYRHFDSAESYENEEMLGIALKKGFEKYGLKREDIWITSKIAAWRMDYENAKDSIETSVKLIDCGYLDLSLIHWPTSICGEAGEIGRLETWKGMVEMKQKGLVKSLGISNFLTRHIEQMLSQVGDEKPVINQIEIHPLYIDEETIKTCQHYGIALTAYAPLATFDEKLMKNENVLKLAEKYGKSANQIALRWGIQRGFIVIPKASSKEHLLSNISIGDFSLTEEEVQLIDQLNIMFKTDWDPKDEP